MAIVKATLRHLLRHKWKLPLAVFLSGVVLVALHHAIDVAGIREAAFEAMREHPTGWKPKGPGGTVPLYERNRPSGRR